MHVVFFGMQISHSVAVREIDYMVFIIFQNIFLQVMHNLWNTLPQDGRKTMDLNSFKKTS